jgi:hypothetical protein
MLEASNWDFEIEYGKSGVDRSVFELGRTVESVPVNQYRTRDVLRSHTTPE